MSDLWIISNPYLPDKNIKKTEPPKRDLYDVTLGSPAVSVQDPWLSVPISRWVWLFIEEILGSQQVKIAH
jgi:hypothetical protein